MHTKRNDSKFKLFNVFILDTKNKTKKQLSLFKSDSLFKYSLKILEIIPKISYFLCVCEQSDADESVSSYRYIEDIYFFEVNTKYIS